MFGVASAISVEEGLTKLVKYCDIVWVNFLSWFLRLMFQGTGAFSGLVRLD